MAILRRRIAEYSQLRSGDKQVSDMPYSVFGAEYLNHIKARWTAETLKSYQTTIRVFGDYLVSNCCSKLSDINYGLIQRFITDRRNGGNKANTCNNYLKNLHAQFVWALEQKLMAENPMPYKYKKIPVTDSRESISLTEEQYQKVMIRIKDEHPYYFPMFYIYFSTGLRFTELIMQEWKDIFFDSGYLVVTRPKGKRRNVNADIIPLNDTAIKMIRQFQGRHKTIVFVDKNGTPFSTRTRKFIRRIQKIAEELGIEGVNLHTTRHTFGSQLIDAGASLEETRGALRHRDIRTTQSYIHKVSPSQSKLTKLLEKKLKI
jgi:Site-specific recombinase XerD